MADVSWRAYRALLRAEATGLFDLPPIFETLDRRRRLPARPGEQEDWPWASWSALIDHICEQAQGDPKRLIEIGAWLARPDDADREVFVAPLLLSAAEPLATFELAARWAGPALFRNHMFTFDANRRRMTCRLRPGDTATPAWFHILAGAVAEVPTLAAYPSASVSLSNVDETTCEISVEPASATSQTLVGQAQRVIRALSSPRALVDELASEITRQQRCLDEETAELRRAFDRLPALVLLHSQGQIVYVNQPCVDALHTARTNLVDTHLDDLLDDADRQALAASERTLALVRIELRGRRGNVPCDARVLGDVNLFGVRATAVCAIDVSQRVAALRAHRMLVDALPDLVLRVSATEVLLEVGLGEFQLDGADLLLDLVNKPISLPGASVPDDLSALLGRGISATREALTLLREVDAELTLDNPSRILELRAIPRADGSEALLIVRDTTEHALARQKLAVSERMASLGTLVAGVAHEINNPLTYIMASHSSLRGAIEQMDRGEAVDLSVLREYIEEARVGTQRVRDIVGSMRSFSRVGEADVSIPTDPATAIEEALSIAGHEFRDRIEITQSLSPSPDVLAAPSKLTQVLVNIIVNAAQALEGSGVATPTIAIELATDRRGWATISITDNGPGVPPNVRDRIFDPFFTTKPPAKGTGLGLSISHRIVRELGGELVFAAPAGGGACFRISIPPAPTGAEPEPRDEPKALSVATTRAPVRVLVVDDEPLVGRAIAGNLRHDGYNVSVAQSGAEALAELRRGSFDVVLSDVKMPGMSGQDLFLEIARTMPKLARRFAFITGALPVHFAEDDGAEEYRTALRARPVLSKPFDDKQLRSLISRLTDGDEDT